MKVATRYLCLLVLLLLSADSPSRAQRRPPAAPAKQPNIVYIMSDDHAAHAISAYGSKLIQTPNIDRLAKEGMKFENAFVTNSICTPSRAVMLTGKYSHLNGVPVFNHLDTSQPLLSKYLQQAGYHTGVVGKWHLGGQNHRPGRPADRVRHKAAVQPHSLFRQPVDVRRFVDFAPIGADCLIAVVVRHDEQDVRA